MILWFHSHNNNNVDCKYPFMPYNKTVQLFSHAFTYICRQYMIGRVLGFNRPEFGHYQHIHPQKE